MSKEQAQTSPTKLVHPFLQLRHTSPATNQRPSKLSRTASYNDSDDFPPQTPASRAGTPRFRPDRVNKDPRRGAQTFPRRALRRASSSFLRTSKSQPASLWNPVNSSALPSLPTTSVPADANKKFSSADRVRQQLTSHHEKQPPPEPEYAQRSKLQSHSSLQVELSQPSSGLSSPKRNLTSPQPAPPSTPKPRSPTALPAPPTMSPHPSLQSDTPSKRPPTPAKDLEYGLTEPPLQETRSRTPSRHSRHVSSTKSDLPWNPTHPCYPHANPHIPLASPLNSTTRIIRIPRDWMVAGDLAPTFSNTYPEILEPWVSEVDFRTLIKTVNERLEVAFAPYGWRAWMDAVLGVATGWIWEDLGFAGVKKGVKSVEDFIEEWNGQRRITLEKEEDGEVVRVIPLRRTAYLCLDIQIPDPHVGMVEEESNGGGEREGNEGAAVSEEERKQ